MKKLVKNDFSHLNVFGESKFGQDSSVFYDPNIKSHNEEEQKDEDLQNNSFQIIQSDNIEVESKQMLKVWVNQMLKINLQMANEKDDTTDGIKSLNEEIKLKSDLKDPNEIIDQKKLTNDDIKLTKIANDKINIEIIEINKADIMAKENDLTEKENKLSPNVKSDIKEKDNKESYSVVKMIKIDGEDQQEGVLTEEQKIGENKTVSHNNVDCKEIERNEEEQKENNNKDKILINSEGQKIEQDKSSITETKVKKDGIHDWSDLSQNENQQQIKTEDLKNSANWEKEVENFDSIKVTGKLNNDIEEKDNANEISDQKLVKGEIIELKSDFRILIKLILLMKKNKWQILKSMLSKLSRNNKINFFFISMRIIKALENFL